MDAATTTHKTTEPLWGCKIVDRGFYSLVQTDAPKQYLVGTTVSLDDDNVRPCQRGLHFCPDALDCLWYYAMDGGNRLLRVSVPVGATVATDDDGKKYAASQLHVEADVTGDVASLLTGTRRDPQVAACYRAGRFHRDTNDEPAVVARTLSRVKKSWFRDGKLWKGCLGKYSSAVHYHGDTVWVAVLDNDSFYRAEPDETAALVELLNCREPFE
jgi:hypothetical protein